MAYARIVNLEYKSAEDLEIYFKKWEKWAPDNMPEAIRRTNVRTGENSTLLMAIYRTEEWQKKPEKWQISFLRWKPNIYMK